MRREPIHSSRYAKDERIGLRSLMPQRTATEDLLFAVRDGRFLNADSADEGGWTPYPRRRESRRFFQKRFWFGRGIRGRPRNARAPTRLARRPVKQLQVLAIPFSLELVERNEA